MEQIKRFARFTNEKSIMLMARFKSFMSDQSGDQMTGWMIVILLVVVVGAVFLNTYQAAILDIWNGIVDKAKRAFGI